MDKQELSKLLSKKLGREIKIRGIELVGSGYHSNGYKLITENGEMFFLKQIKSHDLGFEFPERKVSSLLVSHSMMNRAKTHPKSFGVILHNEKMEFLPALTEDTQIYHLQEYGGKGNSYLDIVNSKKDKKEVDKEEINKIVDYITKIHSVKPPSKDEKQLKAIYNDSLRNVIGHQEYLLMLLHEMPKGNVVLSPENQSEFISLMLENMHYFKNRYTRLTALHGDFWGANVFFKENGEMFVIDYSRRPWGEPGFDVGFWLSQYVLRYHWYQNNYFKELGNYFLNRYIKITGDNEIKNNLVYSLGLIAAIYACPKFVNFLDNRVIKDLYEHAMNLLRKKEFFWP